MKVDFSAVLAVVSVAAYVAATVVALSGLSFLRLSFGPWFAIGTVLMLLAIALRPKKRSHA